jgi:RNA recognition motif-containing protein
MEEGANALAQHMQEAHLAAADSNGDASSIHGEQLQLSVSVPAPRHSNVYVSGLSGVNSEDELRQLFAQHGVVDSCRLVRSSRDGKSFAFVKFATIPDSLAAIEALNGRQYGDGTLEVKTADAGAQRAGGRSQRGPRPPLQLVACCTAAAGAQPTSAGLRARTRRRNQLLFYTAATPRRVQLPAVPAAAVGLPVQLATTMGGQHLCCAAPVGCAAA